MTRDRCLQTTTLIVFETHSITEDNEREIATGWLPGKLSQAGRRMAVNLGGRRPVCDFDAIFASDLDRARETAQIAFEGTGAEIRLDHRLRECNYGRLNGMPVERLTLTRSAHIAVPFPEGESYHDVVRRMHSFLTDLCAERLEGVLLIGHSATRWALQHLLDGTPLEQLVDAPFDWRPGWEFRVRC